jgi:hypothetical protein
MCLSPRRLRVLDSVLTACDFGSPSREVSSYLDAGLCLLSLHPPRTSRRSIAAYCVSVYVQARPSDFQAIPFDSGDFAEASKPGEPFKPLQKTAGTVCSHVTPRKVSRAGPMLTFRKESVVIEREKERWICRVGKILLTSLLPSRDQTHRYLRHQDLLKYRESSCHRERLT